MELPSPLLAVGKEKVWKIKKERTRKGRHTQTLWGDSGDASSCWRRRRRRKWEKRGDSKASSAPVEKEWIQNCVWSVRAAYWLPCGTYSAFTCGAGVLLPALSICPLTCLAVSAGGLAQTGLESFNLQRHTDTKAQRHKDTQTQRHKDTQTHRHKGIYSEEQLSVVTSPPRSCQHILTKPIYTRLPSTTQNTLTIKRAQQLTRFPFWEIGNYFLTYKKYSKQQNKYRFNMGCTKSKNQSQTTLHGLF